ncbi:MAG: response regulator [Acidobacteriaceae bacterium]|nr:response regulator [Acidobacteriaceae bacterium]
MFGYQREELLGQLIEILIPESLRQQHQVHRDHYAEHPVTRPMGIGLELFARRKDATQFPVEISLSPIRSPQGSRVIAMVRDITNRKQAEAKINAMHQEFTAELGAKNRQLEIRNQEVERANRLKSEFLASMSHELRTPLHTIIGFADLLGEELKGGLNDDQKRFVAHIQRDSRHLLELINDILDLSKIESGRLELHPELFNAADAIVEAVAGLRALAENKQIRISEIVEHNPTIQADRLRFKEVLYNLIGNAIKFTPENGQITVECRERPDGIFFAVTDTGIGIDPSEQQAIFDKFYQLGSTTRGVREGTGLGLTITKSLVEMHGGRIWVESTPGVGSRFQIVLPRSGSETPLRQLADEKSGQRGPILLVGMDQNDRQLADFLGQRGCDVAAAQNAEQALQMSRDLKPAAVVLDLGAAGPETWRTFQDLRAGKHTAQTPVVVLTAGEDQSTASCLGANAALPKPIEPALVLRTLEEQVLRQPGEPARILVVDDNPEACELLEETLRSAGVLPVLASSGKQALETLARSPIAAVVVDLLMPEMSGFELIFRIRQNPGFAQLPIIVLTAKEMDQEDAQILSGQANAVFLKASPWKEGFLTKVYELLQQVTKA